MKKLFKKSAALLLALIFVLSLAACGDSDDTDVKDADESVEETAEETAEETDASSEENAKKDASDKKSEAPKKKPSEGPFQISFDQKIIVGDVMELTFTSSEWCEEIMPSNTTSSYSYKSDNEGEKYFVIKGTVKNIAGETLDMTYTNESELLINDTYKSNITINAEDNDGAGFYDNVKPLQTLNFIAYSSVSDELYDARESITATFNFLADSSRINYFFDMDDAHETYFMEFEGDDVVPASYDKIEEENELKLALLEEKERDTSIEANIALGEVVTVGDVMEITFESSEWCEEIMPSNTTSSYSYKSDNEGEKYFVIKGTVKNIAGENLDMTYANESEILINGLYKAKITIDAEDNDGAGFYDDVKPLQTLNFIAYASVSDELYEICDDISATFNILSDASRVTYFFDMENAHETYYLTF